MNLTSDDHQIIDHYTHFWGKPNRLSRFSNEQRGLVGSILVAEFIPLTEERDWIYATIGMSREPMPYPKDWTLARLERRAELFLYSRKQNENLPDLLWSLAKYPFEYSTFLGPGHTMQRESEVITGATMSDILLLKPIGEPQSFQVVHLSDDQHAQMLWVIPVHRAERTFVKEKGTEALIELFFKYGTDTSDFRRSSVI